MKQKDLNIKRVKLGEIIPYENNPRDNDDAVEYVANSIRDFGFKVPIIVDENNIIVAGHTRLKASKLLGLEEVPCIVADDLDDDEIKAFRLADNKTAEYAMWDNDKLLKELDNIEMDLGEFGFNLDELYNYMEKKDEKEEVRAKVKFTEELGEESNYIVLKFDTAVDWLNLQTVFELPRVKALDSKEGYDRMGVGRVVDGVEFIEKIKEGYKLW